MIVNKLTFLLLLLTFISKGQANQDTVQNITKNSKYVVWYSPSKATNVYGIMLNFLPELSSKDSTTNPLTISGIELNINPIGAAIAFPYLLYTIDPNIHKPIGQSINEFNFKTFKKINGIEIATLNMDPSIINGLDLSLGGSHKSVTNGLTISGIINKHCIINGMTIGLIANHDINCNGVQIGLINSAKRLRGFQFGLWNKNQHRSLPVINWAFK